MATDLGQFLGGGGDAVPSITSIPSTLSVWTSNFGVTSNVSTGSTSTLTDLVNITSGSGYVNMIRAYSSSTNNYRVVVIIDGTTVWDQTALTIANDYLNIYPQTGQPYGNTTTAVGYGAWGIPLRFNTSCRLRFASAAGITVPTQINYVLT